VGFCFLRRSVQDLHFCTPPRLCVCHVAEDAALLHGDMEPLRRRCMGFLRSQVAHHNQVCCCPLSSHCIDPPSHLPVRGMSTRHAHAPASAYRPVCVPACPTHSQQGSPCCLALCSQCLRCPGSVLLVCLLHCLRISIYRCRSSFPCLLHSALTCNVPGIRTGCPG
jgi:hypothetical protein